MKYKIKIVIKHVNQKKELLINDDLNIFDRKRDIKNENKELEKKLKLKINEIEELNDKNL